MSIAQPKPEIWAHDPRYEGDEAVPVRLFWPLPSRTNEVVIQFPDGFVCVMPTSEVAIVRRAN